MNSLSIFLPGEQSTESSHSDTSSDSIWPTIEQSDAGGVMGVRDASAAEVLEGVCLDER